MRHLFDIDGYSTKQKVLIGAGVVAGAAIGYIATKALFDYLSDDDDEGIDIGDIVTKAEPTVIESTVTNQKLPNLYGDPEDFDLEEYLGIQGKVYYNGEWITQEEYDFIMYVPEGIADWDNPRDTYEGNEEWFK